MRSQRLTTKILLPRHATGSIQRPRLLDLMSQVAAKQVSVVKGGHGYGKTSLAVTWAEQLRRNGASVAWLSLDEDDDEPARFLFYISHALHRANERIGKSAVELVSDISLFSFKTVIAELVNDMADIDDDIYLFLDDYQYVADPEVQDALSYFIAYAPEQFHLVIISTGEIALPLSRLRANNQLVEFDASLLRFSLSETREFLERERVDGLDAAGIRLLHAKTEGWPALLRIVAATLCQPGQDFGPYVAGMSGAARPIGGYLSELLSALPRDIVEFMCRTSILDRFSASLCQAVTASRESRDLLDVIEADQLLLIPLDQNGSWYRYHALLRDHLQERLVRLYPHELPRLHRRAYRWYAANELWTDAIRHALSAGDSDQAVAWIERCAMDLVKRGDLLTLLSWQRIFPSELMRSQINVRLAIAWGMALAMRFGEALRLVAQVREDAGDDDQTRVASIECECDAILAVVTVLQDDTSSALPVALSCLERTDDPWTANVVSNVALLCHLKSANLEGCYAVPWIPYSSDGDRLNLFASVYRRCLQGLVEYRQLRSPAAERVISRRSVWPNGTPAPARWLRLCRRASCLGSGTNTGGWRRPRRWS